MTCLPASGAALSIVATAPIWRACARFLCVDIGDNDLAFDRRRRDVIRTAADAARPMITSGSVFAQMAARLFMRGAVIPEV